MPMDDLHPVSMGLPENFVLGVECESAWTL